MTAAPPATKAFASQADLADKKITFERLSPHCWAYTAEGDPNSCVIIGDKFIMVSDATATPALIWHRIHAAVLSLKSAN